MHPVMVTQASVVGLRQHDVCMVWQAARELLLQLQLVGPLIVLVILNHIALAVDLLTGQHSLLVADSATADQSCSVQSKCSLTAVCPRWPIEPALILKLPFSTCMLRLLCTCLAVLKGVLSACRRSAATPAAALPNA